LSVGHTEGTYKEKEMTYENDKRVMERWESLQSFCSITNLRVEITNYSPSFQEVS
jgi:hypothetical protein